MAGTVNGAAELLNVSAPGISRVMKHAENQLGIRLFARRRGRFIPTREAQSIFGQLNAVFQKVEDLQYAIDELKKGVSAVFSFGSVPSISQYILPRAVRRLRGKFPDLRMEINVLKIEEAINYVLLKKGELVAMSYKVDHPGLMSHPLAVGSLVAIVPAGHELSQSREVSPETLADYPLIGIDPNDPYGRIMASVFLERGLDYQLTIQARFAQTVYALVRQGLGVALIDEFSVCGRDLPGVVRLPVTGPAPFRTYAVVSADEPLSIFAEDLIDYLRSEMYEAVQNRPWM
ncbi:MAG: LysR family transcriptional regulator [Rhodospirillales bacterium]|nr:MAG: LysR family transcriptional regulator [Rhodospirillales bacterium]